MVGFIAESLLINSICGIVVKGQWSCLSAQTYSKVTAALINQVLLNLSAHSYNPSILWAFFKDLESLPNYKHSLQSSWTMIHILAKHRHFNNAQDLLDKIIHRDFLSSQSVLSSLVKNHDDPDANSQVLSWLLIFYGNSRMTQEATQVFEQMRTFGLRPHLPACTVFLNCLTKERMTDSVWKVYKKMLRLGVIPNLHIYNVLIHACCKSKDAEKAETLLSEMESRSCFPDLFTYNTLISLYCKKGMHYEALSIQDRMDRSGVSPDIVTYNTLLHGYCQEGRMREAVRLFRDIRGLISPNQVTYTTLIDGYCRINDIEEALRLLEVMVAKGLYPNVVTYNSILRKLCEDGRMRDANKLLAEMSERKLEPDNITCNTLINAYCKIRDMRSALRVKTQMLESGLKLDQFTYKALIHGFCKTGELDNAQEMLISMVDAGFSPSYSTYSWIVDEYCNDFAQIMRILNDFVARGLCVGLSVYRAFIRRLCKLEKIDYAEELFRVMQKNGISGDSVIYTSLAYAYFRAGNLAASSNLIDDMYKKRMMISLKLYRSLNASYEGENHILRIFWSNVADRGVMSKTILKENADK